MLLSVLMSVYRSEQPAYLDRAMQSIWSDQSYKPDEIVLIEDGTLTDELYEIISKWKTLLDDKLVILKNRENLGLTKSLNLGLLVVKGTYIARMDSDDISMPDRFKMQIEYLETHPDVAVVGGSLQEFNAECDCLNIRRYPQNNKDIVNYIYKASPCAHPTVMMRKTIFDNGLKYNERYRTSQDVALWFDVLCAGYQINNIEDVVVKFRLDGDVFNRRSRSYAMNEFRIYCTGIRRLYGVVTWRYIYPLSRLIFRMMPVGIIKYIYGSSLRKKILNK